MNEFESNYLAILRRQVEEELSYLLENGHNTDKILDPCLFCLEHRENYYRCARVQDLKMFLSSIAINQSEKLKPPQVIERHHLNLDALSEELRIC